MENIKNLYLFGRYIISDTVSIYKVKKNLTEDEVDMLEENMPKGKKQITTVRSVSYATTNGLTDRIKNIRVNFRKENLMIVKHERGK